jgi:hypothetical protein
MKSAFKLILVVLTAYTLLAVGVFFHSHSGQQDTAKCQLCQHSQIAQEQAVAAERVASTADFGPSLVSSSVETTIEFSIQLSGRDPPTC